MAVLGFPLDSPGASTLSRAPYWTQQNPVSGPSQVGGDRGNVNCSHLTEVIVKAKSVKGQKKEVNSMLRMGAHATIQLK